MSNSSSQRSSQQDNASDLVRVARPIAATEAARIEEEARERAAETGQEVMGERRRGRVEAEAHRVSEEMTRRAQEQHRAAKLAPAAMPPAKADEASRWLVSPPVTIRRVLVPLSGATFAERAIPFAVAVARLAGASLAFIHVGDQSRAVSDSVPLETATSGPAVAGEGSAPDAMGIEKIERIDLPDGPVAERLLSLEARDGSDVVVVATRRHLGAEGDTLGTVVRALVRHGRAPVLVIPPDAAVPAEGLPTFRRVLVPLDGSALAEQALAPLVSLTRERPGATPGTGDGLHEIVLFSVAEASQAMNDAYAYLNDVSELLQPSVPGGVRFTTEARLGSAPGAIVAGAEQGGEALSAHPTPFDLVILATHGRGGLRRWLLGSVAEYVLTHATVPVLVVRPTLPPQIED